MRYRRDRTSIRVTFAVMRVLSYQTALGLAKRRSSEKWEPPGVWCSQARCQAETLPIESNSPVSASLLGLFTYILALDDREPQLSLGASQIA